MTTGGHAFIFAGGGTGGHIFPAIAIAEEIVAVQPDATCTFVCSTRALDSEILTKETIAGRAASFQAIDARPFGLRPRALLRFFTGWGGSLRASRAIIARAKASHPQVTVIAMGGFVAAPMAQAARIERVPLVLVNLDAVPGRANRWISGRANHVFTASPLSDHAPSNAKSEWTLVPPIVRSGAVSRAPQSECRMQLGLDPDRPTLLVTGASQGAGSINEMMIALVRNKPELFVTRGWQVIHQTGRTGVEAVCAAYQAAGVPCVVQEFFRNMGVCWRAADAAVSRSGAGSVAEAWANATPCVFMPYPYHKDEHQRFNAMPLVEAGAAILAKDRIEAAANLSEAGAILANVLTDSDSIASLKSAYERLGPADGARRVALSIAKTAN